MRSASTFSRAGLRRCRAWGVIVCWGVAMTSCLSLGCVAKPNQTVVATFQTGQFGQARVALHDTLPERPARGSKIDRDYLLGHLRVGILTLADGYPDGASSVLDRVYDILRMQGLNRDMTVPSVLLNEDLKIWKGEPFEQALAYSYIAAQYASQGSWDNARAAAGGAMFHLRDFGVDENGRPLDTQAVVTRASREDPNSDDVTGYRVDESDFALGHLINGVANQQLGRQEEAQAHYRHAVRLNQELASLVRLLRQGDYNTLLMVDFGRGPEKVGSGPDQAIATFEPRHPSDGRWLLAWPQGASQPVRVPVACDVNVMARDHRWNNLEDMRIAKSHIGTGLIVAGAVVATHSDDAAVQLAGLGLMLGGAIAKSGAHADTRYCEALPQRIYLLPLMLEAGQAVTLQVDGLAGSRMVVTGAAQAMSDSRVQFRYVRLMGSAMPSPPWAASQAIHYTHVYAQASHGLDLPYILGGHCVLPPSDAALARYQQAGFLRDMTANQLRDLYLAEDIVWDDAPLAFPGLHVLEGGRSLACPWPGTTGYKRLFGQRHPSYQPRSREVREAASRVAEQLQSLQDRQAHFPPAVDTVGAVR